MNTGMRANTHTETIIHIFSNIWYAVSFSGLGPVLYFAVFRNVQINLLPYARIICYFVLCTIRRTILYQERWWFIKHILAKDIFHCDKLYSFKLYIKIPYLIKLNISAEYDKWYNDKWNTKEGTGTIIKNVNVNREQGNRLIKT